MSADNITGKTYFLRGKPVRVLIQWSRERAAPWCGIPLVVFPRADGKPHARRGPRNVLIERADGSRVVRSFRGLRKEATSSRRAARRSSARDATLGGLVLVASD